MLVLFCAFVMKAEEEGLPPLSLRDVLTPEEVGEANAEF